VGLVGWCLGGLGGGLHWSLRVDIVDGGGEFIVLVLAGLTVPGFLWDEECMGTACNARSETPDAYAQARGVRQQGGRVVVRGAAG